MDHVQEADKQYLGILFILYLLEAKFTWNMIYNRELGLGLRFWDGYDFDHVNIFFCRALRYKWFGKGGDY